MAVKWHLRDEALASEAGTLLRAYGADVVTLSAPAFIRYELAQALRSAVLRGRISEQQASTEFGDFVSLGVHAAEDDDALVAGALRIAGETGASVYDATYVAHAESLGLELVTADDRLVRRLARHSIRVRPLAEVARAL